MREFVLVRQPSTLQGTKGSFSGDGFSCLSLELPWMENKNGISCIPAPGKYLCKFTYSPRYKRNMYVLQSVKGRSGIRIHSASFAGSVAHGYRADLLGCIALGNKFIKAGEQEIIIGSRATIAKFERFMGGKDFILEIRWANG